LKPQNSERPQRNRLEDNESACIRDLIRKKARRLARRAGFTLSDVPDLQQMLQIKFLRALRSYDPAKSPILAFAKTVVDRYSADLIRNQRAEKRHPRGVTSLSAFVCEEFGAPVSKSQTLDDRSLRRHRSVYSRTDEDRRGPRRLCNGPRKHIGSPSTGPPLARARIEDVVAKASRPAAKRAANHALRPENAAQALSD
jgi:DNA-directed RNA polymerase specialized sigma24 family protein